LQREVLFAQQKKKHPSGRIDESEGALAKTNATE
jgi:hypothetical protein